MSRVCWELWCICLYTGHGLGVVWDVLYHLMRLSVHGTRARGYVTQWLPTVIALSFYKCFLDVNCLYRFSHECCALFLPYRFYYLLKWPILMSIILLITSVTWYNMVYLLFSFKFKFNLVLLLWLIQSLGARYTRFKSRCVDDIIYSFVCLYVCWIWPVAYAIQLSVLKLFLCFILINYATLPPLTKLDTSISTMLNNTPNISLVLYQNLGPII